MDKGIRPYAATRFAELNVQRKAGELDNTKFRKTIIAELMDQFNISLASAATHYNTAFKNFKATNAADVEGLGRPDDKKGGRKPKVKAEAAVPPTVTEGTPPAETPAAEEGEPATIPDEAAGAVLGMADEQLAPPQTYSVKKKSDGTVVAEGLTIDQAEELVAKAKAAKKAALEIA